MARQFCFEIFIRRKNYDFFLAHRYSQSLRSYPKHISIHTLAFAWAVKSQRPKIDGRESLFSIGIWQLASCHKGCNSFFFDLISSFQYGQPSWGSSMYYVSMFLSFSDPPLPFCDYVICIHGCSPVGPFKTTWTRLVRECKWCTKFLFLLNVKG